MPLRIPDAPPEVYEVVADSVASSFDRGRAARGGEAPGREVTTPHRVFTLGLDDLTKTQPLVAYREAGVSTYRTSALEAARETGWRYLVQEQGRVVESAETVNVGEGRHEFSHFNEGPFVASSVTALEAVKQLAETQSADLELRLLHIPALHALAFWLRDEKTGNDLLVPLYPAPPGIEPYRTYPASEMLDLLRTKASELLPDRLGETEGS